VHGEDYFGAHRLPAGKTAAEKGSADVLPVRQQTNSKIDYCWYPRHSPRL
jgi:hypothetical protein